MIGCRPDFYNQFNFLSVLSPGVWATGIITERKLCRAFNTGKAVFLFFSFPVTSRFLGVARMTSVPTRTDPHLSPFFGANCGGIRSCQGWCFDVLNILPYDISHSMAVCLYRKWLTSNLNSFSLSFKVVSRLSGFRARTSSLTKPTISSIRGTKASRSRSAARDRKSSRVSANDSSLSSPLVDCGISTGTR